MWIESAALVPRPSLQGPDHFAVLVDLQNPSCKSVGHIDGMIARDKETERMAQSPFAQIPSVQVENLDAPIFAIADVDEVVVNDDGVGKIELAGASPFHSPAEQHVAVLVKLEDARITFAVRDIEISFAIERHIGGLIEMVNIIARCSHSA